MTITLPLRRITLHFSHMRFTEGRTFISYCSLRTGSWVSVTYFFR